MSKKILFSLMAILLAVGVVGAGAFAQFFDTETSTGNTFTAGTLDLKVGGNDDPAVVHFTVDMKPGDTWWYTFKLKNTGSIPGQPWVEFSTIINNDNGCNEPEVAAGDSTPGDAYGKGGGELGGYIRASIDNGPPVSWWWAGPLYTFSGKKFGDPTDPTYVYPRIGENQEVEFYLKLELQDDAGNIVQSDSVEFDITFHLDQ